MNWVLGGIPRRDPGLLGTTCRELRVFASRVGKSSIVCPLCSQALYLSWVVEARRNILAILQDMPSLHPPIDHLCELLPRLQARYYSIASSSKVRVLLQGLQCPCPPSQLGTGHGEFALVTSSVMRAALVICMHEKRTL